MNCFSTFMLTVLLTLTLPVVMAFFPIYKTDKYSYYVKMAISYAFFISLIPTLLFINSGHEAIISSWHWMTLQTVKLTLSLKLDYFSLLFVPGSPIHYLIYYSIFHMMYTLGPQHQSIF